MEKSFYRGRSETIQNEGSGTLWRGGGLLTRDLGTANQIFMAWKENNVYVDIHTNIFRYSYFPYVSSA